MNNGLAGFLCKPFTSSDAIALADSVIERARERRTGAL
jgi:hypothetical protein